MDFKHRRDAYCGKFSVTDVFYQYKIPFTVMKPHVVHPLSDAFKQNLADFAAMGGLVASGSDAGAWAVPHGVMTEYHLLRQALGHRAEAVMAKGIEEVQKRF